MQTEAPSSRLRVLVVDDCRDGADALLALLGLWGHEGRGACDGPSALEQALDYRPDVVLLDLGLPGMDGLEVARRLRQLPGLGGALLVALTGYCSEAHVRRCEEAGIDCHFAKPADQAELERVLARAAGLRHLAC